MPAKLTSRIPEIMAELPARSKALSLSVAEETASAAASRAPVATGTLRNSLEAKSVAGGAAVYAVWYWFLVEFGTKNVAAHPYLIPAFEAAYASVFRAGREAFTGL